MKAKQAAARRRKHEANTPGRPQATPADELSWREVRTLLDEEIARLPKINRVVFVLFYLENLSREETARRLGLKDATVAKRLATARERLSQRLAPRGVELTAVLAVTAAVTPPASALSAGLIAKTMNAVLAFASGKELASAVSVSVVELLQDATAAMIGGKTKAAMLLLLMASVLAGASAWASGAFRLLSRGLTPPEPPLSRGADAPRSAKDETAKTGVIQGRVVAPDGKPVKDARLHWPHFNKKESPRPFESLEMVELGRSDDDGRYRITLPAGDDLHDTFRTLVVTAAGYGLNWVELPKGKPTESVTVRLPKDVPLRGRVLSMEGRPLTGVKARVETLEEMRNGKLDQYLTYWEQDWSKSSGLKHRSLLIPLRQAALPSAITDQNGCFQLTGVGSERIVNLEIRGKGIAHAVLPIVARSSFDPSALNKAARNRAAMMRQWSGKTPLLYGPSFEFVALPERIIEGVVREAGSGKPVRAVHIHASAGYRANLEAISDENGRYRLEGLPKMKRTPYLSVFPPPDSPWLPSELQSKEAPEGLQPTRVDFTLGRGVIITGRAIDRSTGKGVTSSFIFDYSPNNKFAGKSGYNPSHHGFQTEADGHFRVKVVPGTGVLKAHASGEVNPFLPAEFSSEDRKHVTLTPDGDFTTFDGGIGFLKMYNAVKWFDLAPDAGVVEQDLYLERGATAKVRILDPQGKPLSGAIVSGIDAILLNDNRNVRS